MALSLLDYFIVIFLIKLLFKTVNSYNFKKCYGEFSNYIEPSSRLASFIELACRASSLNSKVQAWLVQPPSRVEPEPSLVEPEPSLELHVHPYPGESPFGQKDRITIH
jgi:hypothetical protein